MRKLKAAPSDVCQIAGGYRNGCTLLFREDLQEISKTFKTGCRWASSLTSRLRLDTPEFHVLPRCVIYRVRQLQPPDPRSCERILSARPRRSSRCPRKTI